ncbi:MAG: hypothetical protein KUG79_11760 [Pseudomonadales bacterium]|nr:hypothetical protein [Pseudomonadales bacterium]
MKQLNKTVLLIGLALCVSISYAVTPDKVSNFRIDTLNSTNRLKSFDPVSGIRIGVPHPDIKLEHQLPGKIGDEWITNLEPWESGAVINGSAYDAVAPARPTEWPGAEVTNFYYIDPGHANCSDSNVYGYPDVPRCTMIPKQTVILAGSRLELASTNGEAGYYNDRYGPNKSIDGTRDNPIWIIGNEESPPFITASWSLGSATWLYIENLTWGEQSNTSDNKSQCLSFAGTLVNHIVVRNNTCINRHFRNKSKNSYSYTSGAGYTLALNENSQISYVHFHNNLAQSVGNAQYEFSVSGSTFTTPADRPHSFIGGEAVYIIADAVNGKVPAPLVGDRATVYSVINTTSTTLQLAIEGEATAINLTDSGVGGFASFRLLEVAPSAIAKDLDTDYHSFNISAFGLDRTTGSRAHHIWFTDNRCLLGTGDCIQITGQNLNSSTADDARDVIHHLWANGNICEKQRQVCVGSKTLSHFVASENLCLQNGDGGGCFNLQYAPNFTWYMFNTTFNTSGFSRNSTNVISPTGSSSELMTNYWLNNIAVHTRVVGRFNFSGLPMSGGFFLAQKPQNEPGSNRYIGWNTCIDCYTFYSNPGSGTREGVNEYIYKNAYVSPPPPTVTQTQFSRVQQPHYIFERGTQKDNSHFDCNLIDNSQPFRTGEAVSTTLEEWQESSISNEDLHSIYSDPMLTFEINDLTVLDATPNIGSPLVNPGADECSGSKFPDGHDPFAEFKRLYGEYDDATFPGVLKSLNIFVDHNGNPREVGGISDIGAIERQ